MLCLLGGKSVFHENSREVTFELGSEERGERSHSRQRSSSLGNIMEERKGPRPSENEWRFQEEDDLCFAVGVVIFYISHSAAAS